MRKTTLIGKYLVIDTETSGLNPNKHGLIQVAALALDRELQVIAEYNVFILPPNGTEFDPASSAIHNIPMEKLEREGISYEDFCLDFIYFIKNNFRVEKPVLAGQFIPFDYGFLDKVFNETLGESEILKDPNSDQYGLFNSILTRNFIDTKTFASILNLRAELDNKPPLFQSTSLSKSGGLKDSLQIPQEKFQAHDALGDCYATLEVLEKMIELIEIRQVVLN